MFRALTSALSLVSRAAKSSSRRLSCSRRSTISIAPGGSFTFFSHTRHEFVQFLHHGDAFVHLDQQLLEVLALERGAAVVAPRGLGILPARPQFTRDGRDAATAAAQAHATPPSVAPDPPAEASAPVSVNTSGLAGADFGRGTLGA